MCGRRIAGGENEELTDVKMKRGEHTAEDFVLNFVVWGLEKGFRCERVCVCGAQRGFSCRLQLLAG